MRAAVEWCGHASDHARTSHGKPWSYLLVPHDRTGPGATFAGIVAAYQQPAGR
jgi:type III restriction enzyme